MRRLLSTLRDAKDIVAQAALAWIRHDASTMGAALAFYTVFSIAPILVIAIGVVGLAIGTDTVQAGLLPQMQVLFGDAGASAVQTLLLSANHMGKSRLATLIGVVVLLMGASSVFVELQNSLDRIWGAPARSRAGGLWQVVRARFLSLGLVFGVGFLLLVSLLVSTILTALDTWIASFLGEWRSLLPLLDLTVGLAITTVLFALVYKYIPQLKIEWRDVWVGALVAASLFNIGKLAIGYYLGRSAFAPIYGAAGSLLVLLLWAYYSAQIFLFGAELTKSFSFVRGTRRGLAPAA
ncbi:MAG TPA: YihY/virulence factor BrkB family protein [Steroidobacteraceae bacterium]